MTLMEMKISHIPREKLAAWIENLKEILETILQKEKLAEEPRSWIETHFLVLQTLAEDGKEEYTKWLKAECSCGKRLLTKVKPMYGVYLYHDHFTVNCVCGKTHQFKFQLVEEPIEVPF